MSSLIRPTLDLTQRHFTREKHTLVCIGTWFRDEDANAMKPCLVLLDRSRPIMAGRTIPIIIPLSDAWRYAVSNDPEIGDRVHAAASVSEWVSSGILTGTPYQIIDAINDCLRDLYAMPPRPPYRGETAIGDITIKDRDSGALLHENEITNHV